MIISRPYGGIGNRLKCLISSMLIDEDIKLIWEYGPADGRDLGGVWCKFNDLFENEFEEFSSPNLLPSYDYKYVEGCSFFDNINHLDLAYGNNWGDHIPQSIKDSHVDKIFKLKPVKYIRERVEEFSRLFGENTISVSIRTWKDVPRTRETKGKTFDINKLYQYLDEYDGCKFFVTCDDEETFGEILKKYGDRILYTKKRTSFGDYRSAEGVQDALVDLYLFGKNKKLLLSYGSSFGELQWWFGGGTSETIMMDLHPAWGPSIP
jgi:hypothetical protein